MNNQNIRYGKAVKKSKANNKAKFFKKVSLQIISSVIIFCLFFLVSKTDIPAKKYIGKILISDSNTELAMDNFKNMCSGINEKYPLLSKNAMWSGFIELLNTQEPIEVQKDTLDKTVEEKLDLVAKASPVEFEYPENINMIIPVDGVVTSPFGEREHPVSGQDAIHYGVDIASDKGVNILTTAPGKVIEVKVHDIYGNCVLIQHTERIKSFYAHMESVNVKEGDIVNADTIIGTVGDTGVTTGPHLHFGVRVDDNPVDPEKYISMKHG